MSITDGDISETVVLSYLVCDIDFPPDVVRADAGYLSKDKVQLIADLGAAPFVKPKRQPELLSMGRPAWKHMLLRHREDPEGLANEYNLRWRHEAFFSKLKRRFGPPKGRNGMMRCREVWMRILILNILAVAGEQVEEERDDTSPVPFLPLMAMVRRGQSHESERAERLRTSSRPLARERSCQCCLLLSQLQPCRPRGRQLSFEVSAQGRPLRSPRSPDVRLRGSIGSPP